MNSNKLSNFNAMIFDELDSAETKHPKFCDRLCESGGWSMVEKHYKEYNDNCKEYLGNMLFLEEFSEALNAYDHGDKQHCLQELAQCGAVILRMMEFVDKETKA